MPQAYTVFVKKLIRVTDDRKWTDLSDAEFDEIYDGAPTAGDNWMIGERTWLELDVVSSPTVPPRCVALRAPYGIATPELRFPLAGIVTEATAAVASRDGTFTDPPQGLVYEDMLSEASRARGRRKRTRHTITPERLEEVARIAEQNPRKTTEAVRRHFGYSRGYSRKLIKLAEARAEAAEG